MGMAKKLLPFQNYWDLPFFGICKFWEKSLITESCPWQPLSYLHFHITCSILKLFSRKFCSIFSPTRDFLPLLPPVCVLCDWGSREKRKGTQSGGGEGASTYWRWGPRVDPCLADFPFISGVWVFGTHITNTRIKLAKTGFRVFRLSDRVGEEGSLLLFLEVRLQSWYRSSRIFLMGFFLLPNL